jgi:hypothetical protein
MIFMMLGEYLSLYEKRRSPFLAHEDDRDLFAFRIDVEEHTVLAEEPQLPPGESIRS